MQAVSVFSKAGTVFLVMCHLQAELNQLNGLYDFRFISKHKYEKKK